MSTTLASSLVRDVADVNTIANSYPVIDVPSESLALLPDRFDGRDSWNLYIRPPSNTRQYPSFAIVAKDVLNDRFSLQSGGQIGFDLDYFQILACKDKAPMVSTTSSAGSMTGNTGFLNGYSIYDAWEFIYGKGLSQVNCFSLRRLQTLKYPAVETLSYDQKVQAYGVQCSSINGADDTQCLEKWNNIPIAKRIFLPSSIYNITSVEMTTTQKIKAIQYDLTKWGPVAAGFVVYENFLQYSGRDVYTAIGGNPVGGHYVTIIGWKDDYWICRNNWGANWGLMGYFRVKMAIPGLGLEDNVSACMPQLYDNQPSLGNGKWRNQTVPLDSMGQFNPSLFAQRQALQVNYSLFYSAATIAAIQLGKVHGDLTPLIADVNLLPNLEKFWVMDIQNYNFQTIGGESKPATSVLITDVIDTVVIWVSVMSAIAIFVWAYNKKE
jgi:hypothetical protein